MAKRQIPSGVYLIRGRKEEGHEALARKAEKVFLKTGFMEKIEKNAFVALKIHFGEQGNTGHIKPRWIVPLINQIQKRTSRAFLADSNTLYVGNRSNSVDHLRLAWKHGFTPEAVGVPVIIADGLLGRDGGEVPVNLPHIKTARIGSAFVHSEALVCLSHFTGHTLTGMGGAIKNLGMGCASRAGKLEQHADVRPWVNPKLCTDCGICLQYCPSQAIEQRDGSAVIDEKRCIGCGECLVVCTAGAVKFRWDQESARVQEKMSEYAFSVWSSFKGNACCLNFLLQVTRDCDCMAKNQPAVVEDIGILASVDPVAVDQASVDLVNAAGGKDILRANYELDWSVQLRHGEEIGLGSRKYRLIEIK